MQNELMTERQAADYLQVTTRTTQAWRYRGGGPKFVRISSRCVRYRKTDLDAWIAERIARNTTDTTTAERDSTSEA